MGTGKKRRRPRRTLGRKPEIPVKRVDAEELKALIGRAREGALSEEECAELQSVVETLAFVVRELDEKNLTLSRLRALFGLSKSEKLSSVLPAAKGSPQGKGAGGVGAEEARDGPAKSDKNDEQAIEGHGRHGADAYTVSVRRTGAGDRPHAAVMLCQGRPSSTPDRAAACR